MVRSIKNRQPHDVAWSVTVSKNCVFCIWCYGELYVHWPRSFISISSSVAGFLNGLEIPNHKSFFAAAVICDSCNFCENTLEIGEKIVRLKKNLQMRVHCLHKCACQSVCLLVIELHSIRNIQFDDNYYYCYKKLKFVFLCRQNSFQNREENEPSNSCYQFIINNNNHMYSQSWYSRVFSQYKTAD